MVAILQAYYIIITYYNGACAVFNSLSVYTFERQISGFPTANRIIIAATTVFYCPVLQAISAKLNAEIV